MDRHHRQERMPARHHIPPTQRVRRPDGGPTVQPSGDRRTARTPAPNAGAPGAAPGTEPAVGQPARPDDAADCRSGTLLPGDRAATEYPSGQHWADPREVPAEASGHAGNNVV